MHTTQPSDSDSSRPFRVVAFDGPHAIPGKPHIVLARNNRARAARHRMALADSGLLGGAETEQPAAPKLKVLRPEPSQEARPSVQTEHGDVVAIRVIQPPSNSDVVRLIDEPDGAA